MENITPTNNPIRNNYQNKKETNQRFNRPNSHYKIKTSNSNFDNSIKNNNDATKRTLPFNIWRDKHTELNGKYQKLRQEHDEYIRRQKYPTITEIHNKITESIILFTIISLAIITGIILILHFDITFGQNKISNQINQTQFNHELNLNNTLKIFESNIDKMLHELIRNTERKCRQ